jgi:hypothetical protein
MVILQQTDPIIARDRITESLGCPGSARLRSFLALHLCHNLLNGPGPAQCNRTESRPGGWSGSARRRASAELLQFRCFRLLRGFVEIADLGFMQRPICLPERRGLLGIVLTG